MSQSSKKSVIVEQAVEWLLLIKQGSLNETQQEQFEQWHNSSDLHQSIWQQTLLLEQKFKQLPADIAIPVIQQHTQKTQTRHWILLLGSFSALWLAYLLNEQQQWSADYRNANGMAKTVQLPDGGSILLDANSAIDVQYSSEQRKIILRKGEIWIETRPDAKHRPFVVATPYGLAQALGTKYGVKINQNEAVVAVEKGAVKVQPNNCAEYKVLKMGEQIRLNQDQLQAITKIDPTQLAWTKALLMVDDLPLSQFVERLRPYQTGMIYLDHELEHVKISGTYPLDDLPKLYAMLEQNYQIQVDHYAMNHVVRISLKK